MDVSDGYVCWLIGGHFTSKDLTEVSILKNQNTTPEGANPPRPGGGEGTEVLPTGNYRPRVRA